MEKLLNEAMVARAQGCLMGQLVGDALGSIVEFEPSESIKNEYPEGVRKMIGSPIWHTLPGQPTDDSEMALTLARTLVAQSRFEVDEVKKAYQEWFQSGPFDYGNTTRDGLHGEPNRESQANGALMRISPLGIFGVLHEPSKLSLYAAQDAAITHPHRICQQINSLFAVSLAYAIRSQATKEDVYGFCLGQAKTTHVDTSVLEALTNSCEQHPVDYLSHKGWVIIAFQNAFWQLLHAESLEEGIVDTVMRGGDTDTNAAIAGALLGSVYGIEAFPKSWIKTVLSCRPQNGLTGVMQPRPKQYWPCDALELVNKLL